jgi:hypothetical protein
MKKTDQAKQSGTSPPALVNDPTAMMAKQIDAELVARLKTALKELKSADEAAEAAYEVRTEAREAAAAAGQKWAGAEIQREHKAKATGTILVEARERHPERADYRKILEAVGIEERQARKYMAFALGKANYKEHLVKTAEAVKKSREKNKDRDKAKREADKAAKKLARPKTKAKARAEANGTGPTATKALLLLVAQKINNVARCKLLNKFRNTSTGHVADVFNDLMPKDYAAVRDECRRVLTEAGHHDDANSWPEPVADDLAELMGDEPRNPTPEQMAAWPLRGCNTTVIPEGSPAWDEYMAKHPEAAEPKQKPKRVTRDAAALAKLAAIANAGFDPDEPHDLGGDDDDLAERQANFTKEVAAGYAEQASDSDAYLVRFMEACRLYLPELNDDDLTKAHDFVGHEMWRPIESRPAHGNTDREADWLEDHPGKTIDDYYRA